LQALLELARRSEKRALKLKSGNAIAEQERWAMEGVRYLQQAMAALR
jgi:hypothetical protein